LEELDGVDWLRLQRAAEVERIVNVELRRKAYFDRQSKDLTADEWEAIRKHDAWLAEVYGDESDDE
jgi:hypothetical protein